MQGSKFQSFVPISVVQVSKNRERTNTETKKNPTKICWNAQHEPKIVSLNNTNYKPECVAPEKNCLLAQQLLHTLY